MNERRLCVTVLGCRGSMTISGPEYCDFGGFTSCYLVQAGNQHIFLDAGSGLFNASLSPRGTTTILLSHWHIDHISGLGMSSLLLQKGAKIKLYAPAANDEAATQTLDSIYAEPYWPLRLSAYPSSLSVRAMPSILHVGDVLIESLEGNHPGGCMIFKLSYQGKSLVYVTDYEHEEQSFERLAAFCRNVNLILYDGQYDADNYESHKGFGHSTPEKAIELKQACGAHQLLIVHHDPHATDVTMHAREQELDADGVHFAHEGEVIWI